MSPKIRFVISSITSGILAVMTAAGSEKQFKAGPAGSYAHQTADEVTIGAKPYDKQDLTEDAFGKKTDLLRYGVLPVLVVIENKSKQALDLRELEVNLVARDGRHATAISPEDVEYVGHPTKRPEIKQTPLPMPKKKSHLNSPEIVTRAFAAKMIPPGDSASGFFYFEAQPERGDKIYINGLREARTGQEMLYFEFPLAH